MMKGAAMMTALGLGLVAASLIWADGSRGRHSRIYALPRPGPVVIDGKLDDWDLSGQLFIYVVPETADMQNARLALMYDDEAIYLSGVVRDASPLMNRHDPEADGDLGWDADACQIRLVLDPDQGYPIHDSTARRVDNDQLVHLALWYYTDRKEPALQMKCGMTYKTPRPEWAPHGVVPANLYQAAYVPGADGGGYTFEYRIPWTTMGAKNRPKAFSLVAGTLQINWGAPDGQKTAGASAWCYDVMACSGFPFQNAGCWGKIHFSNKGNLAKELVEEGVPPEKPLPLTFAYNLPEDSQVTVQLFDSTGRVARILIAQGERQAGKNLEHWDGLDDQGRLLPAGAYAWKGLYHQPIRTKFIMSVDNSGQPPYKTDDGAGAWGGDWGEVTTVLALDDGMLLAWRNNESGWGIIRADQNGKKRWGIKNCAKHLATDGKHFFAAGGGGFDPTEGGKVFDLADGRPLCFGNGSLTPAPPPGGDDTNNAVTGLAYRQGELLVAYGMRDLIGVFDASQGTLKTTWSVPAPGPMAVRPDGAVLIVSGNSVVIQPARSANDNSPKQTNLQSFLPSAAERPDPEETARGAHGPPSSPSITERLQPRLDQPKGIAVGPDGAVYVANAGKLQNISVFDRHGEYLRSIGKEGGRPRVGRYEPDGLLEPGGIAVDRDGMLWAAETLYSPKRISVWDTRTGALSNEFFGAASYWSWAYMDPKHPDEIYCGNVLWEVDLDKGTWTPWSTIWRDTAPNMIKPVDPDGYNGHFRVMTARTGRQFGWGMVDRSPMLFMRAGDIFKPIAGAIRVAFGRYGAGILYPVMKEYHEKHKAPAYLWQDANNDQTVQVSELCVSPAGRGETTFNWIDEDMNVWCDAGWMYAPVRFAGDGRPVYDFARTNPVPFRGRNSNATSLIVDPQDGNVYQLDGTMFGKWTRAGCPLWAFYGLTRWENALSLPLVRPGKLWGLTMPLGVAGEFTGAACYFGPFHLFTRDGLYVAMIMRDTRIPGLGADVLATEICHGQLVKPEGMNPSTASTSSPQTGSGRDRYFLLAGDTDGRVTEILGLDTVKRLPGGNYVHRERDVKTAAEAQIAYASQIVKSQRLWIVRGRQGLENARRVSKAADDERRFAAGAAYDSTNLYVAYDVSSPCELINAIADRNLVFKGGNCLDLQIAADPAADPKRKTPVPGDVRVLVTRQKDPANAAITGTLAVVYRPRVAAFTGQATMLKSPAGQESFDSIETSGRIKLNYVKTPDGFKAVLTIPLALLGWAPKPGTTVRMDLGYLYGNATGTQAAMRSYWMNNSFSANVVNDVPHESRLEPAEWGEAVVE